MSEPAPEKAKPATWADYRAWPDDQRWEIVDGVAYSMSPAPSTRHQHILREMGVPMALFFKGKRCRLFWAPCDVKLSDVNIVQPDILVVCDPQQIKPTHIEGAPALVVEIISPSSGLHDRVRKTWLYARFGVKELWLVTPYQPVIEVFVLAGSKYQLHASYTREDELVSATFPDLKIPLAEVFNFPLEPGDEPPIVREPPPTYRSASG